MMDSTASLNFISPVKRVSSVHSTRAGRYGYVFLYEPVELLDTEYFTVYVGLDVVAEITNAEAELVTDMLDLESTMNPSPKQSRNPLNLTGPIISLNST